MLVESVGIVIGMLGVILIIIMGCYINDGMNVGGIINLGIINFGIVLILNIWIR